MECGAIEDLRWLSLRAGCGRKEQKRSNAEQKTEVEAAIPSEIFKQRLTRLGWAVHKFDFNGRGAGWRLLVAIAPVAREPLAPFVVGEE
jgi:hypothetical protein